MRTLRLSFLVVAQLVCLLFVSRALALDVLLEDDFSAFTGWPYDAGNCPGFALSSDGDLLSVTSYGSCSHGDQWEGAWQGLSEAVPAGRYFSVSFHPVVNTDPAGQMGGVVVQLLDDHDNVAAQLTWYEPQAGTGYGGVTFWAEGNLIYGDLSGFDREYAQINSTLKLVRDGAEWSAWVDDAQKGSTFTLASTMTITKVRLAFYNFVNWPERDIKVDFLKVESAAEGWCDDFEGYGSGGWSANWHASGNSGSVAIDGSTSYSGNYSLRAGGVIGGCWGTVLTRPVSLSFPMTLEMAVRNGSEYIYGCHAFRTHVGFRTGPNWWDTPELALFKFLPNGDMEIIFTQPYEVQTGFNLNQWYHIKVRLTVPGDGLIYAQFFVDGNLIGEYSRPWENWMANANYADITVQEGTGWFDDVCVNSSVLASVELDIKPGSCPNPLNIKSHRNWLFDTSTEGDELSLAKARPNEPNRRGPVLPVAVLGTSELDVATISPSSITLEGVPVLRWSIEDVATPMEDDAEECECNNFGPDGFPDLTLKFSRSEIIQALGEVSDGDVIPLRINGELEDGTPFEGTDCVLIIGDSEAPLLVSGSSPFGLVNYPNPFNPTTTIRFSLPEVSDVELEIFNVLGQCVRTLIDERLPEGVHEVTWSTSGVASGVYFYRLTAGEVSETKQMLLIK